MKDGRGLRDLKSRKDRKTEQGKDRSPSQWATAGLEKERRGKGYLLLHI
jgi:hypothetical protein